MGAGNANAAGTSGGGARTGFNTGMQGAPGMPRNVAAGGYPSKQGVGAMSGMLGAGPAMGAAGNALAGMRGMQGMQGMQNAMQKQNAYMGAAGNALAGMRGMQGMQGMSEAAENQFRRENSIPRHYQGQMLNQQAIAAHGEPAVTDFYNKLMASPGYQGGPAPMQGGKGSPR